MSWAKIEIVPSTNYNTESSDVSTSYSSDVIDASNSYSSSEINNSTNYNIIRYLFYGSKQDLGLLNWDEIVLQNWDEI